MVATQRESSSMPVMSVSRQGWDHTQSDPGRRRRTGAVALLFASSLLLFAGATAQADTSAVAQSRYIDPPYGAIYFEFPGLEDPQVRKLWSEGIGFEEAGNLSAANARYQTIAERLETSGYPYWRMSRNMLQQSMLVPEADKVEQVRLLELADRTAERGVELDPHCAECMYWRYRALGRLPTVRGLLSAGGDAKTMAKLLKRGIEVSLAKGEVESNTTLAEFYYASATFNRMVPDWFWLRWIFGVQGNKERAVAHARKAVDLAASRTDYEVELGAALLCLGAAKKRPENTAEGLGLLHQVRATDSILARDLLDRELAAMLIQTPDNACEFSRVGFLDVTSVAKSQE